MSVPGKASPGASAEELIDLARTLGEERFAERAERYDVEASFPFENYDDLREAGLLALTIPQEYGGVGADFATYCRVSAEIGKWCGATALTFNMHAQTTFWTGPVYDQLDLPDDERAVQQERRAKLYQQVTGNKGLFAQPLSEPNSAAAAGKAPFGTTARKVDGGWIVNGMKHFASLAGAATHYSMVCSPEDQTGEHAMKNSVYLCVPGDAQGFEVFGPWDPVGMRATVSRGLRMSEVFVPDDLELMGPGHYFQAASRWPHMFFTLSPTYLGISQAAFDFSARYLRGEVPGVHHSTRDLPSKQMAMAKMRLKLEQSRALFDKVIAQADIDPGIDARATAYAAQLTIMEHAQEICALAIRTCGGRTLLRSFPLERLYRESRCGATMLPWTAEICEERLGKESLQNRRRRASDA